MLPDPYENDYHDAIIQNFFVNIVNMSVDISLHALSQDSENQRIIIDMIFNGVHNFNAIIDINALSKNNKFGNINYVRLSENDINIFLVNGIINFKYRTLRIVQESNQHSP